MVMDDLFYAAFARPVQRPQFSEKLRFFTRFPTSIMQFYANPAPPEALFRVG
jgi:hypothetical protein